MSNLRALSSLFDLRAVRLHAAAVAAQPPPPTTSTAAAGEAAPLGRLPSDVAPTHVDLELEIVPTRDDFRGQVAIDVI